MSTSSMILTKKNIIILSIIIITIIAYQFYITSPQFPSNTITNTINTSGKGLDYTELINLQKDLKAQQTEIRKQLEQLKYSINDINQNQNQNQNQNNNEYNNNKLNDEQENNNNNNNNNEFNNEFNNNELINYKERIKKKSKEQPNTCIPVEGKLLCLPNFIVIGTMKSGTTFLDYYLQKHPQIAHHSKKEIWYFNSYYANGIEWYAKHFEQYTSLENQKLIGEATPFYINNPNTAPRLFTTLKNAKLILLLRDPVERSLSQYHFSIQWLKRNKSPPLQYSFEHLIYEEADVIETCIRGHERYKEAFKQRKDIEKNGGNLNSGGEQDEFNLVDPFYTLHSEKNWTFYKDCVRCDKCFQIGSILHTSGHPTFGMLAKSLYFEQLDYWLNFFPLEQIHIIRYEDISSQPESVLSELEDFLDINHIDYGEFKPRNVVQHDPMDQEIKSYLINYFKQSNEKLYNLLNRDFKWQN
ncbi:hypothetical protein ACTFIZ_004130 [Dictyostelium cf. discoideum]